MVKKLTFILMLFPKILMRLISNIFPRKNNLWLFGSWEGNSFADNSKYFFLHVVKNNPEIEAIWFTRKEKTYQEVTLRGGKCVLWPSLESMIYLARAKFFFSTHAAYDFIPEMMGRSTHIELFHASFPLKKMGYDEGNFYPQTLGQRLKRQIFQPFIYKRAKFSIASSPSNKEIFSSCLKIPLNNIWEVGFPRLDVFNVKADYINFDDQRIEQIFQLKKFNYFFYFVPTFRNDSEFSLFNFSFSFKELSEFLESINGILIIRMHPFDFNKASRYITSQSERIIFENHGLTDPYPLLKRADVLITDFSSIYSDYLLIDKPIIFAKFAFDQYQKKERNLYWNYDEVTPGEKATDWPELISHLQKTAVNKIDNYQEERKKMRVKIFSNNEFGSSGKIVEKVKHEFSVK